MVNRDLTRRVKHIGGVAGARNAVLSDLNLAVKLTRWGREGGEGETDEKWEEGGGGREGGRGVGVSCLL